MSGSVIFYNMSDVCELGIHPCCPMGPSRPPQEEHTSVAPSYNFKRYINTHDCHLCIWVLLFQEYTAWLIATEKNTPIIPGCFLRTQLGKALVAQHSPTPMNTELLPKTRVQCIVVVVRGRFCWCYPMMRRLLFVPPVDDEDIDV